MIEPTGRGDEPQVRTTVARLAPLLDNSRPEIELIHALILSLPGSPCLYYGDEIGMGDNICRYLRTVAECGR